MKFLDNSVIEVWIDVDVFQERLEQYDPQVAREYRKIVDFLSSDYTDLMCSLNAMLERNCIEFAVVDIHYIKEWLEGEAVMSRVVPDDFLVRMV